ncbi:MAG: class I SAM-dependent methyltransferase [Candidatus Glassbacteria bacterium]|nr:class I SAM-dependent methyltransferase [Candidatus Glassbacteria bacterium]
MIEIKAVQTFVMVAAAALALGAVELMAQHQHSGGGNPTRYESEGRDEWQKPDKIVGLLDLKAGMVVADIGASSGYFSRRFSKAVGASGRVLAVDLDTEALAWLANKADELGMSNIDTVHADADDPHLPAGKVDLVFFCNTLHHIGDRVEYLRRLKSALKDDGRVAVLDFYKKDLPVGPQGPGHKLSWNEAYRALRDAGYKVVREPQHLLYQYFIIARPE